MARASLVLIHGSFLLTYDNWFSFSFIYWGGGGGGGVGGDGGRVVRWCWVSFQCRGVLLIWIIVGKGPIALAVGRGCGCWDNFFTRLSFLFSFSLSGKRPDIN